SVALQNRTFFTLSWNGQR
ncbi:hypothetical protein VCHENC02_1062B, partial [Vibrio harveyi]